MLAVGHRKRRPEAIARGACHWACQGDSCKLIDSPVLSILDPSRESRAQGKWGTVNA